ncbi:MAG: hypothetical protein M1831_007485 [Alyxoria varia]|nr:MAG: hypothetical protein M1831_007485 [Alyxoria varia]
MALERLGPRVAIIGAGPAGVVLARLLQQSGVHCDLFDIDKNARTGVRELHQETGRKDLREDELWETPWSLPVLKLKL